MNHDPEIKPIEIEYFEYTPKNNGHFKEIIDMITRMVEDKELGHFKERSSEKAFYNIDAEKFTEAIVTIQNKLGMHRIEHLIIMRLEK